MKFPGWRLCLCEILCGFFLTAGASPEAAEETGTAEPEPATAPVYTNLPSPRFMTRWLICGPFPVQETRPDSTRLRERSQSPGNGAGGESSRQRDEWLSRFYAGPLQQIRTFDFDFLSNQGGETGIRPRVGMSHPDGGGWELQWRLHESPVNIVDLVDVFGAKSHAVAYVYAEIVMVYPEMAEPPAQALVLAFGADDSDKIWLNGDLVHERWGGRDIEVDEDRIPLDLKEGANRLLIKVQNMEGDWGYVCRILTPELLEKIHLENRQAGFSVGRVTPAEILRRNPSIFLLPIFLLAVVVIFLFAIMRSKFDL
ncbi:MAG: hypothetical protein ACE15F_13515 [bacterium]